MDENGKIIVTDRTVASGAYGSPELYRAIRKAEDSGSHQEIDGRRADSYALGLILYRLMRFANEPGLRENSEKVKFLIPYRRRPEEFEGRTDKAFYNGDIEAGNEKVVLDLTEKLLKRDPEERYDAAQAMKHRYFLQGNSANSDDEKSD